MRVSLATGALMASLLLAAVGCSNPNVHPFWNQFSAKSQSATPPKTALTNAPPPPPFGAQAAVDPTVIMPAAARQPSNPSNPLPIYPGTNYQQTPYPMPPLSSGAAANPANASAMATPPGGPYGGYYPPSTASAYPPFNAPVAVEPYSAANPTGAVVR